MTRLARSALLATVFVATLAGCRSGSHASASPSPTAMTNQQILDIGRQYAQCMRDHGVANFPDPELVDGRLSMPGGADGDAAKQASQANKPAQDACQPIMNRLPASARKYAPLSAEDVQQLIKFAQCIREHGVPEWPDPAPDGTFPLTGTPLETEGKSARVITATQACKQYWDKPIRAKGPAK